MSGAGKTVALKMLEDIGFYCVDNLPISLLEPFTELTMQLPHKHDNVALGIDIRSGEELPRLEHILNEWRHQLLSYEILFLDAQDQVLVKRYKETRRSHPLAGNGRVETGIEKERQHLAFLREQADVIMDTSQLLTRELRSELEKIFVQNQTYHNMFLTVLSFGFKYGIPTDADLVFDVRFLPNPFYVESLRPRTGQQTDVQEFVCQGGTAKAFQEKLYDMLDFLIPHYIQEGKNQLVVAIGCTGGKHRSVTVAEALHQYMDRRKDIGTKLEHRDIEKDTC